MGAPARGAVAHRGRLEGAASADCAGEGDVEERGKSGHVVRGRTEAVGLARAVRQQNHVGGRRFGSVGQAEVQAGDTNSASLGSGRGCRIAAAQGSRAAGGEGPLLGLGWGGSRDGSAVEQVQGGAGSEMEVPGHLARVRGWTQDQGAPAGRAAFGDRLQDRRPHRAGHDVRVIRGGPAGCVVPPRAPRARPSLPPHAAVIPCPAHQPIRLTVADGRLLIEHA
jgi:hypothetical protein